MSPARYQPHLLIPSAQRIQKKAKNPEMRFNSQSIVLYCLDLCAQKSRLKEVDLELCPKRGSDKITMLKQAREMPGENKLNRTNRTQIWREPVLREEPIEPKF